MGIGFHDLPAAVVTQRFNQWLAADDFRLVVTPNPEMLLCSQRDLRLRQALSSADLVIPDGFGLVLVARILGTRIRYRFPGIAAAERLLEIAAARHAPVYLLGGLPGVAQAAAAALQQHFHGLLIVGADDGGFVSDPERPPATAISRIRSAAPAVLLVALGHGKQERLLAAQRSALPSVRVAIGVGGAFDVWANRLRRAPRWLQQIGLEWLYRLWQQPNRWPRIFRAVIVFPYRAILEAHTPHGHRQN